MKFFKFAVTSKCNRFVGKEAFFFSAEKHLGFPNMPNKSPRILKQ